MSVDIREVGRRLDANVIIEGSVRKAGEKLRITVQAIQTESGHDLWSEVFRRELKDVVAIQEEIAQSIAVCSEFICQWRGHECTHPLVISKPIPDTYEPVFSFINSLRKHCARHWSS